jgi:hypothetical protein
MLGVVRQRVLDAFPPPSEDLFIAAAEIELGVARRSCPACSRPLVIRQPPAVAASPESAAFRLDLHDLTTQDRRIFDAVYAYYPHAVPSAVIEAECDGIAHNALKQAIHRMRPRLETTGWQLLNYRATLRLIGPAT